MKSSSLTRLAAAGVDRGRLTPGVSAQRRSIAASCVLSVLRAGAELAQPWPLAIAIDWAIDGTNIPAAFVGLTPETLLIGAGVATLAVTGTVAVLDLWATRFAERAAERLGAQLRERTFTHALRLPLRWHAGVRTAELVSRLTSDVGRVLDALVAVTITFIPDVLAVIGVLALLLVLDPRLAALGLVVVPVLALLSARQRRRVRSSQVAARSTAGRLTATASDLLRNVLAVQAFNRADRASAEFAARNRDVVDVEIHAIDVETRWTPASDLVLALGAALVLVAGGFQVRAGLQSTGHLLVVLSYLRDLYSPVRALTRLSSVLAKASASADRIVEVLDAEPSDRPELIIATRPAPPLIIPRAAPPLRGPVSFRGVSFGYEPDRPVLRDLDLDIASGETVCLYGPSGVGKSTLLLLLLRLYEPDAGTIRIDGVDLRTYDAATLRERIAYVPQDPWLLDATLAQNVAFGSRTATRAQVINACRIARVDEFVDRLPLGYDTPLGEGASRLSGGQRRRVALARAAVSTAELLLLDEPTASLDAESAGHVIAAIRSAKARRTTLLVTHDPELAAIADRVVRFDSAGVPTEEVRPAEPVLLGRR